jgi:MFS family permease
MSAPRGIAAFRHRDFALYWLASLAGHMALQMQMVAIGWQVYDLTRNPLDLGLVGLAEFLPAPLLVFLTGHAADRFERRRIVCGGHAVQTLAAVLLLALALRGTEVWPILAVAVLLGIARAFSAPASRAMTPILVPAAVLPNAVAWRTSAMQASFVGGPALGGLLYAAGAEVVYGAAAVLLLAATLLMLAMGRRPPPLTTEKPGFASIFAGVAFIWRRRLLFGLISLDLFAVLFGGATALLPIYARDILMVGPEGLGVLRAAPAVGAVVVALALARWPVQRAIGRTMFLVVAIFGLGTIVFGVSENFRLSLAALAVLGAADSVSVFIRSTLMPLATPDAMRGRVTAVEMVFIGASNELGAFESGVAAALLGTVPAVVFGGVATLAVVALWIRWFPELYRIDRFDAIRPE